MGHANSAGRMPGLGSDDGEIMISDPPSYFVIRRNTDPASPPIKAALTGSSLPVAAPLGQ
jgi:hypothetical protein